MPQAVIDNPILNSPFDEPTRHFRFDEQGITNDIVETRRVSSYFTPIAQPKKKGKQLQFEVEWTQDRLEVAFLLAKLTLEKHFRQDGERTMDRPSVRYRPSGLAP